MNTSEQQFASCYQAVTPQLWALAKQIRLLILDVDGVLSDGLIYMGNQGEELKAFHVRDGYGIRCVLNGGIEVALITGRQSQLVADRCATLGIRYLYQGQTDKQQALAALQQKLACPLVQMAYLGDDLIDLPVMCQTGLSIAVADAHPLLLPHAHYRTRQKGGHGAVREVCDLLLLAQDKPLTQGQAL